MALTSAEAIYDRLVGDAELLAGLGTYALRDGTTRPAARVALYGERLEGVQRQGVELTVMRNPFPQPEALLTDETLVNPLWRVYVAQWTPGDGLHKAWPVARRVLALLPGASATPLDMSEAREAGQDMGILDQYAIRWTDVTDVVVTPAEVLG